MTEYNTDLFGLFVECVEEVSFDGVQINENENNDFYLLNKRNKRNNMYKIFEGIILNDSTNSLSSLSSYNSMSSMSSKEYSQADFRSIFTPQIMMDAVASINSLNSSNCLSQMDYTTVKMNSSNKQQISNTSNNFIQFFFHALEVFINKSEEDESSEFPPKFC